VASDTQFKVALILLFSAFTAIRAIYRWQAIRLPRSGGNQGADALLLRLLIPFEVITFFVYLFFSPRLAWTALPLPGWLRWIGAVVGGLSLLLLIWTHQSLGHNFSVSLYIREGHALIQDGPYRWVRHPMYTFFYLLHLAAFLLTANWFIGLTWIGGLTLLIATRIEREEEMMIQRFGQAYRAYQARTGRFFVRLRPGAATAKLDPPAET
jgi:protein-S-isoprenylcysteine O-methyltransferase Ste14